MKNIFVLVFSLAFSFHAFAESQLAQLRYDPQFILEAVLNYKHLKLNDLVKTPSIFLKSNTSVTQFQDAIEVQWGQRPAEITNAFAVKSNEIYLMDDADYYQKTGRCMDDSLAHEYVHFVQTKYQNFDINDESLEWDAIDIQTWFRETYCK